MVRELLAEGANIECQDRVLDWFFLDLMRSDSLSLFDRAVSSTSLREHEVSICVPWVDCVGETLNCFSICFSDANECCRVCQMALAHCLGGFDSESQHGTTALIWAAHNGHADCVRLLIDAGADKDAKDQVRVGRCFAEAPSRSISPFLSFTFVQQHVFLLL